MTINVQNNILAWDWELGAGGPVDGFRLYYGLNPGDRNNAYDIPDPAARSTLATNIATLGPGPYYVVVVAYNAFGISGESNEVTFDIAAVPAAPTNLRLELIIPLT